MMASKQDPEDQDLGDFVVPATYVTYSFKVMISWFFGNFMLFLNYIHSNSS